jgi:hypothetical protein
LTAGHYDPAGEFFTELRGEKDATFVIEFGFVRPEQHGGLPSVRSWRLLHFTPFHTILLHFDTKSSIIFSAPHMRVHIKKPGRSRV